jgi:hypothetical protein
MIKEITARVLLSSVKQPDPWFGIKYNMNLCRGCQHQCIYCDSRSTCYPDREFRRHPGQSQCHRLMRQEPGRKRVKGTIGTGSMNDPYMPIEAERRLTARALAMIAECQFPVHILTKSDRVLRDLDALLESWRFCESNRRKRAPANDSQEKTSWPTRVKSKSKRRSRSCPCASGRRFKVCLSSWGECSARWPNTWASWGEQPAGPAFVAHHNMDMQNLDIEQGFPVSKPLPAKGEIQPGEIPPQNLMTLIMFPSK